MADQNDKKLNMMERFRDLPDDLQNAVFSPNTADAILAVGKKAGIAIDKIGELADETGLVMLGLTPPGEFIRNLTKRLEVDPEKAKAIAEEINQKIFQPVRESLKRVHGLGERPPSSNKPPGSSKPGFETAKKPGFFPPGGAEKKPLPTREEIKMPPPPAPNPPEKIIPPELKTPELPPPEIATKVKAIFDEIENKKTRKNISGIPPIFAKNIPLSDNLFKKDELEADLEKKLSEAKPQQNNYQQKSADPYREPIE